MDTNTITTATTDATVQHVTKKSSDQLLMKFAQVGTDEKKELRVTKRRKISRKEDQSETSLSYGGVERRSLLPPAVSRRSVLLRQIRGRDNRNKSSLLGTIHKTWRRTVEGASRVFIEKQHYHRHKRLINDTV